MLFGASDGFEGDEVMQVTLAFNHFGQGLVQRMPRCRWGFVHVVNNDYTHWLMYAIGGSQRPTILSQGNRFIAPPDANCKEVRVSGRSRYLFPFRFSLIGNKSHIQYAGKKKDQVPMRIHKMFAYI